MTHKEKTIEIERICKKVNKYISEKKDEMEKLRNEIKQIESIIKPQSLTLIQYECAKKGVSEKIVENIVSVNFPKPKKEAEL